MYAAPPVAIGAPAARRGGLAGLAPCLAVFCLLLLLLALATTIILSLIPVYTRDHAKGSGVSQTYYLTLNTDAVGSSDGQLDQTTLNNIARAIEQQRGFPAGSVVVTQGSLSSTNSGRRRKRRAGGVDSRIRRGVFGNFVQKLFCAFYLILALLAVCPPCLANIATKLAAGLSLGSVSCALASGGPRFFLFLIIETFSRTIINIPPPVLTITAAPTPAPGK